MEFIEDYNQKKDFNNLVLLFIENDDEYFKDITNFIKKQNFTMNEKLLQEFIYILTNIISNHHRSPDFYNKIIKILELLTKDIQQQYSNEKIFNLFSTNKRILLSFIQNEIILLDKKIINILSNHKDDFGWFHRYYFSKEIEPFLTSYPKRALTYDLKRRGVTSFDNEFEEKRLKGENESYICTLIREDSSIEFISYVNRNNISLVSKIKPTIFETNLLLKKETTLIEYAAFYGSIEIFQYLKYNNVPLTPTLWIYSIHSNNGNLIHILEDYNISPPENTFKTCLKEAIKCHHNNMATYFLDKITDNDNKYDFSIIDCCFKFENFSFLPEIIDVQYLLYIACKYNKNDIVTKILESKQVNMSINTFINAILFSLIL